MYAHYNRQHKNAGTHTKQFASLKRQTKKVIVIIISYIVSNVAQEGLLNLWDSKKIFLTKVTNTQSCASNTKST